MIYCWLFHKWGKWSQFQKTFMKRDPLRDKDIGELYEIWQSRTCDKCGTMAQEKVCDGLLEKSE